VVSALLVLACAAAQREARLRRELDGHRLGQPLAQVWPSALRLLDERGFDLASEDRVSIGKAPLNIAARFLSQARGTRSTRDGRWVAETDLDASDVRYRVEGADTGDGTCRVTFHRLAGSLEGQDVREHRDVDLELELVRRVDPAAAAQLTDAAR
jgi:hypothetical protein